eukprot:6499220-Pyramimonas_sp.AAC.1
MRSFLGPIGPEGSGGGGGGGGGHRAQTEHRGGCPRTPKNAQEGHERPQVLRELALAEHRPS